jgi:hypothetical protein
MDVIYAQNLSNVTMTYKNMSNFFTPKGQKNLAVLNATKRSLQNPN